MNNSNKRWKLSVVLLILLVITSCGMTPAEKQEFTNNESKRKTSILNANKLSKAKKIFSKNKSIVWKTDPNFKFKNMEKGVGLLWQFKTEKMRAIDTESYCRNKHIVEFGLTAINFRLPSAGELESACIEGKVLIKKSKANTWHYYVSSKSGYRGRPNGVKTHELLLQHPEFGLKACKVFNLSHEKQYRLLRRNITSDNYVKCVTDNPYPANVMVLALTLGNDKIEKRELLELPPKPIKNKKITKKKLVKKEFETTNEYISRKLTNDKEYAITLEQDNQKQQKAETEWKIEIESLKLKHKEKLKRLDQNSVYWDAYSTALYLKYGAPKLNNVVYNADEEKFYIDVVSERGMFNQRIAISLSVEYAPKFKKLITSKSFSPTVELDIRNGEIFVAGIKEIADPALIVERDEYNKAKSSITKLNTFIKKYPNSTLVVTAKIQMKKLQHIAEKNRLATIELAKDNADGEIIGTHNLEGAKFVAGRIWQDQAANNKRTYNFEEAEKYCKNYRGLGASGWRLPSENNFESLKGNVAALAYRPTNSQKFTGHFSRDENCIDKGWGAVSKEECIVAADLSSDKEPHIIKTSKSWKLYPRCVLSAYKYNQHAKNQEAKYLSEHTLDGYINAFMAAGDDVNIRKAFELAKTNDELAKVEMALIKYFGLHDVFSLKGSLVTKDDSEANRGEIDASLLLNMISSSGNAEFKYEVLPNANSTVPLKYGKYKVRLKVKLAMNYINTMKKALFGLDLSTSETEIKEREFEVILSPDNGWKASGNVDFGTIMQGTKGAVFVFKMETKLRNIKPSFDLLSIEKM